MSRIKDVTIMSNVVFVDKPDPHLFEFNPKDYL